MNRTAFITGGARGIGAAIAAEFTARGCTVLAPPRAELELGSAGSIESFLAAHSALEVDILVNNAGINFLSPIDKIDPTTWHQMLQVNTTAAFRLMQAFAAGMKARRYGRILNVSSIFGSLTKESRACYSVTKAGLNALTRSAALEYGPYGIMVNSLAPGYVDTELTRQNNSPAALASIREAIALRRLATPAELARVAWFLCSEENTYLTGQTVVVDGGFSLK